MMAKANQIRTLFMMSAAFFLMKASDVNSASCTTDCTPFTPGVVAYWPLNAETKGTDLSGNGNHATFGDLTFTAGPTGEPSDAVHFHGNANSYALINMSSSMEVGKYPGFSFCGFVRFSSDQPSAPILEFRNITYGVHISAHPSQNLEMNLYISNTKNSNYHNFFTMKFTTGLWRFFGIAYSKASGIMTGFMDGIRDASQLPKNLVAETRTTSKVGLGINPANPSHNLNGDMSCMMLFKASLTFEEFERVWKFCRSPLPDITVTDTATTTTGVTASWTKPPGSFVEYSITIEGKRGLTNGESTNPKSLPPEVVFPKVSLMNLIPGATYRIHIWYVLGATKRRVRTSPWFTTKPVPVDPESISFSMIKAESANASWKEVTGNFDAYSVYITPRAGGVDMTKDNPRTVPREMVTTSLQNLKPESFYTITIQTKSGTKFSLPSTKSFQTSGLPGPEPAKFSTMAITGVVLAVIGLVVIIVLIAVIVIQARRIGHLSTAKGNDDKVAMRNLGFQKEEPSESNEPSNGHGASYFDGYEVPYQHTSRENTAEAVYENVAMHNN